MIKDLLILISMIIVFSFILANLGLLAVCAGSLSCLIAGY